MSREANNNIPEIEVTQTQEIFLRDFSDIDSLDIQLEKEDIQQQQDKNFLGFKESKKGYSRNSFKLYPRTLENGKGRVSTKTQDSRQQQQNITMKHRVSNMKANQRNSVDLTMLKNANNSSLMKTFTHQTMGKQASTRVGGAQYETQRQPQQKRGASEIGQQLGGFDLSMLMGGVGGAGSTMLDKSVMSRYERKSDHKLQLDKIEKSYINASRLSRKAKESEEERMSFLDQSSLSKRIIHKIKQQQHNQMSNSKTRNRISDMLYNQTTFNQQYSTNLETALDNKVTVPSNKFVMNNPMQVMNSRTQSSLNKRTVNKSSFMPAVVPNAKSEKQMKTLTVKKVDSSPMVEKPSNPMLQGLSSKLFQTEQKQKSLLQGIGLDTSPYQEDTGGKNQGDLYEINDKRLKQFYQHLDSLNNRQVSPFQQLSRYKLSMQQPDLNKSEVVNSVQYKIRNSVHSQWIVDEMQKVDKTTNISNQNIFKLCQKLHKDRGPNDRRAIISYLKNKVNFFKDIEKEKLDALTQKIATLEYEPKQIVINQGDEGDFLLIIYEGKVEIHVDGRKVAEAGPHTLIGEAALEYKQKRKASVIALHKCKCLAIYKADYDSAVALFKSQQKQQNQNLLRHLHVIGDWNIIKIKGFSRLLNETHFTQGQVIYDIGAPSEVLYIIKSGRVALEVLYEIERANSIPVGQKQWEIQRTFQIVRRTILTLAHTTLFGMEEVILENQKRIIRARALEDTECLYANKTAFMEYFNTEDKEKFREMINEYTDFEKEGRQLLFEIQNKKHVSNLFLDAVNLNIGSINDKASRPISQLGQQSSQSYQNLKKGAIVKKFLQRIVSDKQNDSPLEKLKLKNAKRQQYIDDYYSQNGEAIQESQSQQKENSLENIFGHFFDNQVVQAGSCLDASMKSANNSKQFITPEKKMRDYKLEMMAVQQSKKDCKTLTVKKQSILVNSNCFLDNLKSSPQKHQQSRNKSQLMNNGGGGLTGNGQVNNQTTVQFVENGVKVRLLTEKPPNGK